MKLALKTDFWDYYDAHFDLDGDVFERISGGGMSRRGMFSFLREHGYVTPQHGIVGSLGMHPANKVVVYLDEHKHQGDGKELMTYEEALERFPDQYGCQYIPSEVNGMSETWRYLQLGDQSVWLRYRSDDPWRSNCGDVNIEVISHHISGKPIRMDRVLYAIDFVGTNIKYAVDYNEAPGLHRTGLEEIYRPKEVVDHIKAGLKRVKEERLLKKGGRVHGC